jgi:flagellar basal-body rod protein FlgC
LVFDPSHPDANEDGYVSMPNVQVVEEMVDMISASTAYRAAANAVMTVKTMAQRALDLAT